MIMASSKVPPKNPKAEIVDAVLALAREKDISEDLIIGAIEEACKAAFRRNLKRGGAPMNLAVSLTRQNGVQVFARKVVSEEMAKPSCTGPRTCPQLSGGLANVVITAPNVRISK